MLIVLLNWVCILIMALVLGKGFYECFFSKTNQKSTGLDLYIVLGLMILTVYAQIYSLFAGVGKSAFLIIGFVTVIISFILLRKRKKKFNINIFAKLPTWKICVGIVAVVCIALWAMKSPTFVDTYLYHAQAIRWIEEYGVVPGLGNLHFRFAYNSAFLPLQALFSFAWGYESSMHFLNGFLGYFFVIYAVSTNHLFSKEKIVLSDFLKVMVVLYIFLNRNNISSPGTDIPAMLLVLYIFMKWSELTEAEETDIQAYSLLCILSVFAVTVELSTASCVLLTVFPAYMLMKEKKYRFIFADVAAGIVVALPWLIRNVIISGYLVYPYGGINLFNFDWKMPMKWLETDRKEVIVWGRGLKDVSLYDTPFSEWIMPWFNGQMFRDKIIIAGGFLATAAIILYLMIQLMKTFKTKSGFTKNNTEFAKTLLQLVAVISVFVFLLSAPLMRYGVVYFLIPIAICGYFASQMIGEKVFRRYGTIGAILIIALLSVRRDEAFSLTEPQDYWKMENGAIDWQGIKLYMPSQEELNDYIDFPAIVNTYVLDEIEPRGNELDDGFRFSKDPQWTESAAYAGIICWGDSLTAGACGGGVSYPGELKNIIKKELQLNGAPIINMGVGGEDTNTILGRSGAVPFVTAEDMVIPTDGSPVEIKLISQNGKEVSPLRQGNAGMEYVIINGIKGTITIEQENYTCAEYTYWFTANEGELTNEVTVPAKTEIITAGSEQYRDYVPIVYIGENGGFDSTEELIAQQRAILEQYSEAADNNRFLVIGSHTGTKEERQALEAAMEKEYGEHYINLREYMSTKALEDAGITPTDEDLEMMEKGMTPASVLAEDRLHFNAKGYKILARLVFERMQRNEN